MKTAATVILVLALVSFIHKEHKHDAKAAVYTRPPITYTGPTEPSGQQPAIGGPETGAEQPQYTSNDLLAEQQIVSFAKTQYKSLAVSDATLQEIAQKIVKYSTIYSVDYALAAALIARESRFNPNATSPHGAKGLGQLIDSTAAGFGVTNSYDIDQNLNATLKYMRGLLDRWAGKPDQTELALASYLLGPRAIDSGGHLTEHSVGYVNAVLKARDQIKSMK
ncbi:MAG: transglycosylase SLT domain-containing protein [bacterium]